jgi:hypothetical protein
MQKAFNINIKHVREEVNTATFHILQMLSFEMLMKSHFINLVYLQTTQMEETVWIS